MAPETKIGSRPPAGSGVDGDGPEPKRGKKKLLSVIIGVVVLAGAGAGYWFLAGPGAASAAEPTPGASAEPEYELGEVLVIDSISINLQGGHYLRLGLGLQLVEGAGAHGPIDPAKALDAAIALYSGRTQEELADGDVRESLKAELTEVLLESYHEEVVGVYYTDFVTQ